MIESSQNSKIKIVRSLQGKPKNRRESGAILCEGVRLLEEAAMSGWACSFVLYSGDVNGRTRALISEYRMRGDVVEEVAEDIFREISDTENSQGVLAVLEKHVLPIPPGGDFFLIPAKLRDPGNLGTILRTAAAAGVSAALIPPETVDPFAPKVMRAGMGAHFRLPILSLSWEEIGRVLHGIADMRIFLAAAGKGEIYTQADLRLPTALMVGGEAFGAEAEAARFVDDFLQIPMPGSMESLNAAVAGAVLMFEVLRQRRKPR